MARVTIKNNSVEPLGGPNLGIGTDQGDSWNTTVANLNNMLSELKSGLFLVGSRAGLCPQPLV